MNFLFGKVKKYTNIDLIELLDSYMWILFLCLMIMLNSPPAVCGTSGLMETSVVSAQWEKVKEQSSTSHSAKAPARGWKRSSSPRSTGRSCSQRRWWGCSTPPSETDLSAGPRSGLSRGLAASRSYGTAVHFADASFVWSSLVSEALIDCRFLSQLWITGLFAVIKSSDYVLV